MEAVPGRAWDGRAGLVRLWHRQGRLDAALEAAQPIITHLEARLEVPHPSGDHDHGLATCEQPLRVHLSVAQLLLDAGDGRADAIVQRATRLLAGWVDSFDEPARRHHLVEIPYHDEILQLSRHRSTGR